MAHVQRRTRDELYLQIVLGAIIPTLCYGLMGLGVGLALGSAKGILDTLHLGRLACFSILRLSKVMLRPLPRLQRTAL